MTKEDEGNILEAEIKNFANYLMEFGLLNTTGYIDFCKKFNEINNNIISSEIEDADKKIALLYFKDNASKAILEFLNNLSEPRKLLMALNIYSKYEEKKENKKQKQIEKNEENRENEIKKSISSEKISQIESKNNLSDLLTIEKFYFQFLITKKHNDQNISVIKPKINNYNDNNLYNKYTRAKKMKPLSEHKKSKSEKYTNFFNKRNNKQEITKENSINENCVFQPNMYNTTNNNKKSSPHKRHISQEKYTVFDRLFQNSKKKKEILDENLNKNWFQPNYSSSKNRTRESFDGRLKKSEENRKLKEKIKKEEEQKEFHEKFPFAPKTGKNINKNKSFQSEPIYLKLYKENDKKRKRQELRIKQNMNEIKNMSNHPIMTRNKVEYLNILKNSKTSYTNKNKITNYNNKLISKKYTYELLNTDNQNQKIEQLYNNYKNMKNIIQSNRKENKNNYNQHKEGYGYIKYSKEINNNYNINYNINYNEELIRNSNINKNDVTNEQSKYANEGVNDISENRIGVNDTSGNKLANENEKISIKKLINESGEMNEGDLLKENEIMLEDKFGKNNINYLNSENKILNEDDLMNEDLISNGNDVEEGDINLDDKNDL